ncbi:MAG: hypothetical protein II135_03505, partial [Clostridia bacterium]|nr:hypothetical protein [Clostridia bacterium]
SLRDYEVVEAISESRKAFGVPGRAAGSDTVTQNKYKRTDLFRPFVFIFLRQGCLFEFVFGQGCLECFFALIL